MRHPLCSTLRCWGRRLVFAREHIPCSTQLCWSGIVVVDVSTNIFYTEPFSGEKPESGTKCFAQSRSARPGQL